jgi:hypothetical protein
MRVVLTKDEAATDYDQRRAPNAIQLAELLAVRAIRNAMDWRLGWQDERHEADARRRSKSLQPLFFVLELPNFFAQQIHISQITHGDIRVVIVPSFNLKVADDVCDLVHRGGSVRGGGRSFSAPTPTRTAPSSSINPCRMGLEGVVSKRLGAPYRSGQSRDWIKVKNPNSPAMIPGARRVVTPAGAVPVIPGWGR